MVGVYGGELPPLHFQAAFGLAQRLVKGVGSKLHTLRVMLNFVAARRLGTCCPTDVGALVVCRA